MRFDQFIEQFQRTRPLKVNVFPSALIYNPLVLSPASDVLVITKPNGLLTQLLAGVNIAHYPVITPTVDVLLHPNQIDALPEFSPDLAILKPSSQLVAVGFIYILPAVTPANDVGVPAFKTQFQTTLESGYYVLKLLPCQLIYNVYRKDDGFIVSALSFVLHISHQPVCVVLIAVVEHPKYNDEYSVLQFPILIPLLNVVQVRPVGLTYSILFIIPPLAKSQVIGIYAPFDTPLTTSYVNISVILLVQQVLQSDTTIVTVPADSNLTYAEQIADVPDPE
ncbi:MAG: hypothetical protein EZS28_035491 [Streblomastix strix]|uniref:Uncharacterized protein n=1 Tax=Streblomastix strix TaxID=222440 RepID=A0A5J4UFY5_9EUKA|nr:MAG: hypothetical protein EZS28_035491 [Streblomastix strix]